MTRGARRGILIPMRTPPLVAAALSAVLLASPALAAWQTALARGAPTEYAEKAARIVRGKLDLALGDAQSPDASASDAVPPKDSSVDANNPIDCALCVGQSCSNEIIGCVTSPACIGTLNCVFSNCLTGGSVSTTCALACAGEGGPQGLLDVLGIIQCVTTSCGPDCNSVLGGLGAGLGGRK